MYQRSCVPFFRTLPSKTTHVPLVFRCAILFYSGSAVSVAFEPPSPYYLPSREWPVKLHDDLYHFYKEMSQ